MGEGTQVRCQAWVSEVLSVESDRTDDYLSVKMSTREDC